GLPARIWGGAEAAASLPRRRLGKRRKRPQIRQRKHRPDGGARKSEWKTEGDFAAIVDIDAQQKFMLQVLDSRTHFIFRYVAERGNVPEHCTIIQPVIAVG